jgi:glycyl-tRNA synthetase
MVHAREDVVGLDSSIILPRQVWVASGHVGAFTDPLTECLSCHKRFRATTCRRPSPTARPRRARRSNPDDVEHDDLACPTAAPAASGPSRATST